MRITLTVLTLCVAFVPTLASAQPTTSRRLSRATLEDKIRGGWAGQMIGVSYGAPTEFRSNGKIIEGNLNKYLDWSPERLKNAIDQDDLYVEMTFAEVMDKVGLEATTEQYGEMFKDSKYELWHANAGARRNLNRGIKAPMSGHPKYNLHAERHRLPDRVGLHRADDPGPAPRGEQVRGPRGPGDELGRRPVRRHVLRRHVRGRLLRERPPQGRRARAALDPGGERLRKAHRRCAPMVRREPDDWTTTWRLIEDKWDKGDLCPDGALEPFNIDAKLNGAYVALGLLYGKGDFAKTLEVSTRSGQDSDCNPSSAAGILGVMLGLRAASPTFGRPGCPRSPTPDSPSRSTPSIRLWPAHRLEP